MTQYGGSSTMGPSVDMSMPPQRKVAYEVQGAESGARGFWCFLPCTATGTTLVNVAKHTWAHLPRLSLDGTLSVNFLSYNLFIRPPGIKNNQDDFKTERIEEFLTVMNQYDVVGLQEMFSAFSSRQQQLIDLAAKIGFKYHAKPKPHGAFSPFLVDGGLLILSKFPIVETDSMTFIQGVQSDALASKGAVYARIQLEEDRPTSCVNVFVTHTQASYTSSNATLAAKSEKIRMEQIRQLAEFISQKLKTRSGPGVLLGDLNVNGRKLEYSAKVDSEEYERMMSILYTVTPSGGTPPRDLLKEACCGQPVTYGDVIYEDGTEEEDPKAKVKPREVVLTHPEDLNTRQRLDYIFLFDPYTNGSSSTSGGGDDSSSVEDEEGGSADSDESNQRLLKQQPYPVPVLGAPPSGHRDSGGYTSAGITPKPKKRFFKAKLEKTRVEPFFITERSFTQISDHYGVSTTIVYHRNGYIE